MRNGLFGFAGIARSRAEVSDLPSRWNLQASMLAIFFDSHETIYWRCLMVHGKTRTRTTRQFCSRRSKIVFEKEMSVWLKHECNTIFIGDKEMRIGQSWHGDFFIASTKTA
jgi:hypothetical protein